MELFVAGRTYKHRLRTSQPSQSYDTDFALDVMILRQAVMEKCISIETPVTVSRAGDKERFT